MHNGLWFWQKKNAYYILLLLKVDIIHQVHPSKSMVHTVLFPCILQFSKTLADESLSPSLRPCGGYAPVQVTRDSSIHRC